MKSLHDQDFVERLVHVRFVVFNLFGADVLLSFAFGGFVLALKC